MKEKKTATPYKLIALDLDYTLLNAKKEVSAQSRSALSLAADAGIHVVLASGRTVQGMRFVLDQLPGHSYTISSGGAVVTDASGSEVYSRNVPLQTAKSIMRYARAHGLYFQVFCNDTFYYIRRTEFTDLYEASVRFSGVEDADLFHRDLAEPSKILIMDSQEKLDKLYPVLKGMFSDIQMFFSQTGYLEILNARASKGEALKITAQLLGLKQDELIAVGDSEIDLPMIEYAGLGIAMANASRPVLRIADWVTASCEEDGVAVAVKKFIFGEAV